MASSIASLSSRVLASAALVLPASAQHYTTVCHGDGSVAVCPCANNGAACHGCANSMFAEGALLSGSGDTVVATDTLVLTATSMSGGVCVFYQGTVLSAHTVFDDGLGCVTGSIVRIGTRPVVGATATYPGPGDPGVCVAGMVTQANSGLRYYECVYRNARATFCPPATSNRTNALQVFWVAGA